MLVHLVCNYAPHRSYTILNFIFYHFKYSLLAHWLKEIKQNSPPTPSPESFWHLHLDPFYCSYFCPRLCSAIFLFIWPRVKGFSTHKQLKQVTHVMIINETVCFSRYIGIFEQFQQLLLWGDHEMLECVQKIKYHLNIISVRVFVSDLSLSSGNLYSCSWISRPL